MTTGESGGVRDSFLVPIPELETAADLLSEAADRLLAGEAERARALLKLADMPALRAFARSAMSETSEAVHRVRQVEGLPGEVARAERGPRKPGGGGGGGDLSARWVSVPVLRVPDRAAEGAGGAGAGVAGGGELGPA